MNRLSLACPCGHAAFHHPTPEQQHIRLVATAGRYPGECKGGTHAHCRCITDRSQVIAAAELPSTAARADDPTGGA